MIKDSLLKYNEYVDSDEEFTSKTRFDLEWDDANYLHHMGLLKNVINDYKGLGLVPIGVVYFFTSGIDNLIGMVSHPMFRNKLSTAEVELIEMRVLDLKNLKNDFLTGRLFLKESA